MGQQLRYLNFSQLLRFNIIFQMNKYFSVPYSFRSAIAQFFRATTQEPVAVGIECEYMAAWV